MIEKKLFLGKQILKRVYEFNEREINSLNKDFKYAKPVTKLELPLNALNFLHQENLKFKIQKSVKIIYPKANLKLILAKDLNGKSGLVARVANLNDEKIFWYLNQKFIYEGRDKSHLLDLNKGKYLLFIISQSGQSDELNFEVK